MNVIQNATIMSTRLGVAHTDHGVLSFYINLDYDSAAQGFGGWCLDDYNPAHKADPQTPTRIATAAGSSLLLGVDSLFGVDWEKLVGLPCRAYGHHSKVIALGHYLKDRWLWLDPETLLFRVTSLAEILH